MKMKPKDHTTVAARQLRKPHKSRIKLIADSIPTKPMGSHYTSPHCLHYKVCKPPVNTLSPAEQKTTPFWTVGFEVEKDYSFTRYVDNGRIIAASDAWAGIESDGSCGYELNSNIFYLRSGVYREWFRHNMMKSEVLLSQPCNNRCGGHMTLAATSVANDRWLWTEVRKYMGLLYSLYRTRLSNQYVENNTRLIWEQHTKYSPMKPRNSKSVEIRLPGKVKTYKQMWFRYDMLLEIAHAIDVGLTFDQYLDEAAKVLDNWLPDKAIASNLKRARLFQNYIGGDISLSMNQIRGTK
jgi:hypothetical protein